MKYALVIEEINNQTIECKNPIIFNMNNVVDFAKEGDFTLLEQLNQATKVRIYEYHVHYDKIKHSEDVLKQYCVCTARKGRNIAYENIGRIVESNNELISYLVDFHNTYCDKTAMPEILLEDINKLNQDIQQEK